MMSPLGDDSIGHQLAWGWLFGTIVYNIHIGKYHTDRYGCEYDLLNWTVCYRKGLWELILGSIPCCSIFCIQIAVFICELNINVNQFANWQLVGLELISLMIDGGCCEWILWPCDWISQLTWFIYGPCHPVGHYRDYCPGALTFIKVIATHLKVRHPQISSWNRSYSTRMRGYPYVVTIRWHALFLILYGSTSRV